MALFPSSQVPVLSLSSSFLSLLVPLASLVVVNRGASVVMVVVTSTLGSLLVTKDGVVVVGRLDVVVVVVAGGLVEAREGVTMEVEGLDVVVERTDLGVCALPAYSITMALSPTSNTILRGNDTESVVNHRST